MTECERILQSGLVPESYLNEEVIAGYKVTLETKKLQVISLDLVNTFLTVCKKHNLKWFLGFGSLLGAVRHKGFIPWDDDIDIFMLREDFEKLYFLKDEFKEPYFLQTPYTDPTYMATTIRVRNSKTSYIDEPFKYQGFNQGISLAIAPLDYIPDNYEDVYEELDKMIMQNSVYMRLTHPNLNERDRIRVANYEGGDPLARYEKLQNIARNTKKSKYVGTVLTHHYGIKKTIFELEDFNECIYVDFENMKLPVPKGYDRVLTTIYGDYMKLPPVEERGMWHSNAIPYPDVPYTDIISKL